MDPTPILPWLWELAAGLVATTWLLVVTGYGLALMVLPRILSEQRNAGGAWAWVLLVLAVPYFGAAMYLLFGGRHLKVVAASCPDLQIPALPAPDIPEAFAATSESLARHGGAPPLAATSLRFIGDGVEAYEVILERIRGARESVDVSVFILYRDEVGRAFVEALSERAAAGVRVRLMLDALGSVTSLGRFTDPVRAAGGEVGTFLPLLPRRRAWSLNLRNHRKMVIVDGDWGMTGGMNFGTEYMGPTPDPARWKDLIVTLEGPVLAALQTIFEEDWHIATGAHLPLPAYPNTAAGVPVQILADGPAFYTDAFSRLVLAALRLARERVCVVSPYYVPDSPLQAALIAAAHTGVRVELLLPMRSNHPSADWARRPFLRELIREGVIVLGYTAGMVHAKAAVVDSSMAWVSSANLDMRSITYNFELAAVVYDAEQAAVLLGWYESLARDAVVITMEELETRGDRPTLAYFCAKEAVYKCQHPLSGQFLEFQDVSIAFTPDLSDFEATIHVREDDCPWKRIPGRFAMTNEHAIAATLLPY